MSKLLGVDLSEARKKLYQEFEDYGALLDTMNTKELAGEVGYHFAEDIHKAAIVCALVVRIHRLEEKLKDGKL